MVDPDRAQRCIQMIADIEDDVRLAVMMSGSLRFDPPGNDEVSVNLARNGHLMASQAELFVDTWANQIKAAREGMQAQLDAYLNVEADNAARLT